MAKHCWHVLIFHHSPAPVRTVALVAGHGHGAPPLALAQPLHNLTNQRGAQKTFISHKFQDGKDYYFPGCNFRPDDGRFLTRRLSPVWQLEPGLVWLTQCSTICNGQRDGFLIHELTNKRCEINRRRKNQISIFSFVCSVYHTLSWSAALVLWINLASCNLQMGFAAEKIGTFHLSTK